ncbi:site-specific integrase [Lentisphaerota bacterium WC36G]|nr:site-specific integrase [Lentisphaerae bacterium WC36]
MARKKGQGSIFLRGQTYYLKYRVNGKSKTISLKTTNQEKAEEEANKYFLITQAQNIEEIALFTGRAKKIINEINKIELKDTFKQFKNSTLRPECSEKTLNQHHLHLKTLLKWLETKPQIKGFADLDRNILEQFFADLNSKNNAIKYNRILKSLKLIYRIIEPEKVNPFKSFKKLIEENHERKEFTQTQIKNIFAVFDNKKFHLMHKKEMKILFKLAVYTGMRLKNCALIEWNDIDLERNLISCIPFKGRRFSKKPLLIPIHSNLKKSLFKLNQKKKGSYVLTEVARRYEYNPTGVQKDCTKVIDFSFFDPIKDEKITRNKDYSFHSFRHSFVSFCANAKVPLHVVQEIVGHSSPAMTRHYTHVNNEAMQEVVKALDFDKNTISETEKLAQIAKVISDKKRKSASDKQILEILKK